MHATRAVASTPGGGSALAPGPRRQRRGGRRGGGAIGGGARAASRAAPPLPVVAAAATDGPRAASGAAASTSGSGSGGPAAGGVVFKRPGVSLFGAPPQLWAQGESARGTAPRPPPSAAPRPQPPQPPLPPPPPLHPDALKFNGPAPEIINGRLAMVGILLVARGEAETGRTALELLQHATPLQIAGAALWVYASMVPILKGARHEAFGETPFWRLSFACTTQAQAAPQRRVAAGGQQHAPPADLLLNSAPRPSPPQARSRRRRSSPTAVPRCWRGVSCCCWSTRPACPSSEPAFYSGSRFARLPCLQDFFSARARQRVGARCGAATLRGAVKHAPHAFLRGC
jgi:hypothetical protein